MRFDGKLDKWNDDRGFGFITPLHGGEPVFVHVSAFARDSRRPKLGEALTFEVALSGDGKKRAVNVQRPGSRSTPRSGGEPAASHPERRGSTRLASITAAVAVLIGGAAAYPQFKNVFRYSTAEVETSRDSGSPAGFPPGAFRCDGRIRCSQMTSCGEAKFFLQHCPGVQMDGDGDGVPCERQWCGGGG